MKKASLAIGGILLGLIFLTFSFGWGILKFSTPSPKAEQTLHGLKAEVKVEFDAKGVPTIQAQNLEDLLFAQGFVIARERMFQMDLLRRQTAGRLSEVVGEKALPLDREMRWYGLEKVADSAIEKMEPAKRLQIEAYAKGVNAFLELGPLPWETKLLGYTPEPWRSRDTVLVALNLYHTLNKPKNSVEIVWGKLYEKLPKEMVEFLTPEYGFFDAPMIRELTPPALPKVPAAEVFSVRGKTAKVDPLHFDTPVVLGSNAWVLSGSRTKTGIPMLSGDPHLRHLLPNIWYRQELRLGAWKVLGVTFAGIPGIVIGANGDVAWSFTTPAVDNVDFVPVEKGKSENTYLAYGKELPFQIRNETLGKNKESLTVRETVWGPVREIDGKDYALQWTARDPDILKYLDVLSINRAKTAKEALEAVGRWAGPPQNFFIADKAGHIAWVLAGKVPKKVGMDGKIPVKRDATHDWKGFYAFSEHPKIVDPPEGYIGNGNQRQVPLGPNLYQWGNNWPLSARAYRIEEKLRTAKDWEVKDLYALQNDIFSHTHIWYRDRLVESFAKEKDRVDERDWMFAIEALVKSFDGNLTVDSAAYPFLKKFRFAVLSELLSPIVSGVVSKDWEEDLSSLIEKDTTIRVLLDQRPIYLLAHAYRTYEDCLVKTAIRIAKEMVAKPEDLKKLRWGDTNRTQIRHPLSKALPDFIAKYLDLPSLEISGDTLVPRVNRPTHGASMRMNVDLSNLKNSIYNHPGGQSGHVLSPHYSDEFKDWVDGRPDSFTPGQTVMTEKLLPKG